MVDEGSRSHGFLFCFLVLGLAELTRQCTSSQSMCCTRALIVCLDHRTSDARCSTDLNSQRLHRIQTLLTFRSVRNQNIFKASTCTCAAPTQQLRLYSNCWIYHCIQVKCEYVLREKNNTKKDLLSLRKEKTVHIHYMSVAHASTTYRKDLLRCVSWRSIL